MHSSALLFIRPPNVIQSFLHPSFFHNQFPRYIAVIVCPSVVSLPSQHSLDRPQAHSFFQLLTLVLCCPILPTDHPGLFQKHLLHVLRANSHVHRHLPFKSKVCHCGNLMPRLRVSHITGPASPLTLSPRLSFEDQLPPRLLVLSIQSVHPHAFRHTSVAMVHTFS